MRKKFSPKLKYKNGKGKKNRETEGKVNMSPKLKYKNGRENSYRICAVLPRGRGGIW